MNLNDPQYLNRLVKQLNPDVLRAAEATMLKADIANLELERDAAVASTVQSYNGEIAPLRARLAELERINAGEQVPLFGVVTLPKNFAEAMKVTVKDSPFKLEPSATPLQIKCGTDYDVTNGTVGDSAFDAAINYAVKYPTSQEPIGPVIPCSTDNEPGNNTGAYFNTPKNAQVVTRDGQTFFVFKSAGYKAIAERLGFPYRPMMDGYKRYLLTPKEYNDVFVEHQCAAKYRKEAKDSVYLLVD